MSAPRLRPRRRYERNRQGAGAQPGLYGFTVRHVRCDDCHRDYLPQHVTRFGWRWICGNCTPSCTSTPAPRLRWRRAHDPQALGTVA